MQHGYKNRTPNQDTVPDETTALAREGRKRGKKGGRVGSRLALKLALRNRHLTGQVEAE